MRTGLLLGAALLAAPAFAGPQAAVAIDPAAFVQVADKKAGAKAKPAVKPKAAAKARQAKSAGKAAAKRADRQAKADKAAGKGKGKGKQAKAASAKKQDLKPGPLADFGKAEAPADVVHVANWVSYTRNAGRRAFVLIDKKNARMYVFDPKGKLKNHTPILLGEAVGDHTAPGIGNKPLSQIKPHEKTTPAGRFLARPGRNTRGDDIIWIDYNAAVSMHRMRKVSAEERRADRMATDDASDNRISYGCVNVPAGFYNRVLKPTVTKQGAFVYVLPETRPPQQLFGSFDVPRTVAKAG